MQRSHLVISVLIMTLMFSGGSAVLSRPLPGQGATKTGIDRPGDALYTPTKLEWAALKLQASYGSNSWSRDSPVLINFSALNDGTTVLCLLQYPSNVAAQDVKMARDSEQTVFDKYVGNSGWSWLRLQFREQALPPPPY